MLKTLQMKILLNRHNNLTREMESPRSYSSMSADDNHKFKSFSDFEQELED